MNVLGVIIGKKIFVNPVGRKGPSSAQPSQIISSWPHLGNSGLHHPSPAIEKQPMLSPATLSHQHPWKRRAGVQPASQVFNPGG